MLNIKTKDMSANYEKLKSLVSSMEDSGDVNKFNNGEKGSNQAGARLRKTLQEIKSVCQTYRKEIQDTVNARKVKK